MRSAFWLLVFVTCIGKSALALGPGFDCAKVQTPVAQFICARPDLSQADLELLQPYYALRHQVGPSGWQALKAEALQLQQRMVRNCGLSERGNLPPDPDRFAICMKAEYAAQKITWINRLPADAAEEASRPVDEHVTLQGRLQTLGFLPPSEKVDGVYGAVTRTAIAEWQRAQGRRDTGFLSGADANALVGSANNNEKNWQFPRDWAYWTGRYPRSNEKRESIFDVPSIKKIIESVLPNQELKLIPIFTVEGPVQSYAQWHIISLCQPQLCGGNNMLIAIRDDLSDAVVCLASDSSYVPPSRWMRWFGVARPPVERRFEGTAFPQCSEHDTNPIPALLSANPAQEEYWAENEQVGWDSTLAGASRFRAPTTTVSGVEFRNWRSAWIYAVPQGGGRYLCLPVITMDVTNLSAEALASIEFRVFFYEDDAKRDFGMAQAYWSVSAGKAPLPNGYSRKLVLRGSRGIILAPGSCSSDSLPRLRAVLTFQRRGSSQEQVAEALVQRKTIPYTPDLE